MAICTRVLRVLERAELNLVSVLQVRYGKV